MDQGLRLRHGDHEADQLLDFVKYFALKASADEISLVGIEGVEIVAHDILVEINQSTPSIYGVPLFPVVDFASTFDDDERQALFDVFASAGDSLAAFRERDLDAALGSAARHYANLDDGRAAGRTSERRRRTARRMLSAQRSPGAAQRATVRSRAQV